MIRVLLLSVVAGLALVGLVVAVINRFMASQADDSDVDMRATPSERGFWS